MRILLFLLFYSFSCAQVVLRTGVQISEPPHLQHQLLVEKELFTELWKAHQNNKNNYKKEAKPPAEMSLQIFQVTEQRFQAIFRFDIHSKDDEKGILHLPKDWIIAAISAFPESENVIFQKNEQSLGIEFNQRLKGEILLVFELDSSQKTRLNLPQQEKITVEFSALQQKLQLQPAPSTLSLNIVPGEKLHLSAIESLQLQVLYPKNTEVQAKDANNPDSPENTEKQGLAEPALDFTAIATELIFTPNIQLVLSREQVEFLGHYQLNVLHQPLFELEHNFQQIDFNSIYFDPPIPFRYTENKLIFPEGLEGKKKLILRFSLPAKPEMELLFPDFIGLKPLNPELYIAIADSTELDSFSAPKAKEISLQNLQPLENLEIPIVKNYHLNQLPKKALLKTRNYPLAETKKLIVVSSKFDSIITAENKIAHSLELELLQNGAQDIHFKLPENAQMFGSYVNQKPVRSFFNEQGLHTIHLRSPANSANEKLQLEIRYLIEKQNEENFQLQAPVGLEAMSSEWNLFFPNNRKFTTQKTNLQSDTQAKKNPLWTNLQNFRHELSSFQSSLKIYSLISLIPFSLIVCGLFCLYTIINFLKSTNKKKLALKQIPTILFIGLIIIMVILALIAKPNFRRSRQRSNDRVCFSNLKTIGFALEMYELDHGRPLALHNKNALVKLVELGYMQGVPECPQYPGQDVYRAHSGNRPYCIHHGDGNLFNRDMDKNHAPPLASIDESVAWEKDSRNAKHHYKAKPKQAIMSLRQNAFMSRSKELVAREKKQYKKVQKSAIKPVRVMFPRLENQRFFHSNIPLEETAFIKFQLLETNKNFISPLLSIASTLLFAIFALLTLWKNNYLLYTSGCMLFLIIIMLQPQYSFIPILSFFIFVFLAINRKVGS